MTVYARSETEMDSLTQVTPPSLLGRYLRGRMRFAGFGQDTGVPTTSFGLPAGAFSWDNLVSTVGQIYTTATQAELQKDLMQMNMERARTGLAPIPASSIAPQVNVGLSPDVQRTVLTVGLGAAAILGGAYALGLVGKRSRRRR